MVIQTLSIDDLLEELVVAELAPQERIRRLVLLELDVAEAVVKRGEKPEEDPLFRNVSKIRRIFQLVNPEPKDNTLDRYPKFPLS